jgi:hypothetical protein
MELIIFPLEDEIKLYRIFQATERMIARYIWISTQTPRQTLCWLYSYRAVDHFFNNPVRANGRRGILLDSPADRSWD